MNHITGAVSLYTFLKFCESSNLEKMVLDCGAGGKFPPLIIFHQQGYKTLGVEIMDEQILKADAFCHENSIQLNISKGDMRKLDFADESISFTYSYNSIFHMTKEDIVKSIKEIQRVLRKGGLCFINVLSVDDCGYGEGEEQNRGEFLQVEEGSRTIHSYYEDNEADALLEGFDILRKEKRIVNQVFDGEMYKLAYIDYIAKKR